MDTFCKTLRLALLPNTLDKNADKGGYSPWPSQKLDVVAPYLPSCLRYIRTAYSVLIKLDLPSEALDIVCSVILDLRVHCMSVLFKQRVGEIQQLAKQETWKIEFTATHDGITHLVGLYLKINASFGINKF